MAFGRSDAFSAMINDHLPYELLKNEVIQDDHVLKAFEIKEGWLDGANLQVPFKEATASSIVYGELEDENDIGQSELVKGLLSEHKTITGSMKFAHRDLADHKGGISKKSFLKILPDELEDHLKLFRGLLANNILNGKKLAIVKGITDAATGVLAIDNPHKLKINMRLDFYEDESGTAVKCYVKEIDLQAREVLLVTTRGGNTPVDFTDTDQTAAVGTSFLCLPNAWTKGFASLKEQLLPASLGGTAQIAGKTKANYTYLQAYAKSGSNISATSILGPLFDMDTEMRTYTAGSAKEIWMSFKNLGTALKEVEKSKGAFNIVPGSRKTDMFNYDLVEIGSVAGGTLKLVGIRFMDDDFIAFVDKKAAKFHTDSFIKRIKSPDGLEYHTVRTKNGYYHIIDHECHGEFLLDMPSAMGVIHSISY